MSVLNNLHLWWLAIWHHFVHGTLPPAPTVGGDPVTVPAIAPKPTPVAPILPTIAPQHVDQAHANTPPGAIPAPAPAPAPTPAPAPAPVAATAPAPAPAPVVETAPAPAPVAADPVLPDGMSMPDQETGAVHFTVANPDQLYAPRGYLTKLAQPFVPLHGKAWWTIEINSSDDNLADNMGLLEGAAATVVEADANGNYGEKVPRELIASVFRMDPKFKTAQECIGHIEWLISRNTNPAGDGRGFVPGH